MADNPHAEPAGVTPSNFLTTAFSRRHASYQRMTDEGAGDIGLVDFNSASRHHHQQSARSSTYLSPTMDTERAVSPIRHSSSSYHDARPVSPETYHENDQELMDSPEARTASPPRKTSKKSKFTEMLRRSLSTSWDSRDRSATPRYEPTRDTVGEFGMARDPNTLHPITEYDGEQGERDRNRDDTDNFSLKYSEFLIIVAPHP